MARAESGDGTVVAVDRPMRMDDCDLEARAAERMDDDAAENIVGRDGWGDVGDGRWSEGTARIR